MSLTTRHYQIEDIPIEAASSLSQKEIIEIIHDLIQTWKWNGKLLGRVELVHNGNWVHVYSYKKPSVQLVSLLNYAKE